MAGRHVKLAETLTALIKERGFSRNRQPVLDALGISAAALSQYARGQTTPSLRNLLALADFFDVSLDYLVYGRPQLLLPDPQPAVATHIRQAFAEAQALTAAHSSLVGRVGRLLSDQIDDATREAAATGAVEGLVDDDELIRLEARALRADIVTIDLDANVINMPDGETAASRFLEVVVSALGAGCSYRFLVSSEPRTQDRSVRGLHALLAGRVGEETLDRSFRLRRATEPTVLGMGLYQLNLAILERDDPALINQFRTHVDDDGWFGYLIRPQQATDKDSVMNPRRRNTARSLFETLWNTAEHVG